MTTTDKPEVEVWEIEKILPYEKNAKKHPPEQVKTLANSIRQRGWTSLIVVDKDGYVIAGHGRRLAFSDKELDFMAADLGSFDTDVFVDDITTAVEEQKTENTKKAAEVDGTAAPIGDAFGFKRLTVAQSRRVRGFMTRIEGETGK